MKLTLGKFCNSHQTHRMPGVNFLVQSKNNINFPVYARPRHMLWKTGTNDDFKRNTAH